MKKYIFIMLAVFFCAAVTVPAFAVDFNGPLPGGGPAVTTVIGGASFIPSTNVYFHICSSDGTATPPNVYNAVDQNAGAANNVAGRQFTATNTTAIQYATAATGNNNFGACVTTGVVGGVGTQTPSPPTPAWTNL